MDVKSSREEFLICGTFKINSIEKKEGERERDGEGRLISVLCFLYIDTKHSHYKVLQYYIMILLEFLLPFGA